MFTTTQKRDRAGTKHYSGGDNQNTLGKYCTTIIPPYATVIDHLKFTKYFNSRISFHGI